LKIKSLSNYLFLYKTSENFPKENIKKIDGLLIFLSIFLSGGFIYISQLLYGGLTIITFILVSVLIAISNKVNRFSLQKFFIILFFVLFILFIKYVFLSDSQTIFLYAVRFINVMTALLILLYFSNNPEYLKKIIYIVLYFIMLHALLSFIAWYVVKNNLIFIPSSSKDTFFYIFYYMNDDSGKSKSLIQFSEFYFLRTSGVFWEGGILQLYMNILLFISLFTYRNTIIASLSIFVILSTWSSTGLVILSIQLFFYIILKTNRKNMWKALVPLAGFSLLLIPLQDNLTNKFEGDAATSGSSYARALDTFTAINIVTNNPLLGIDLEPAVYEQERLKNRAVINMTGTWDGKDPGTTNSVLNYFVFFGVPLGLLVLYSLYYQNIFSKNKLVFFLIIFTSMLTEPLGFFIFPLMLIFSNYMLKNPHRGVL
jgi:hypothetical protein